jgi:hypothetical protein
VIGAANPSVVPVVVLAQICALSAIYGARDNDLRRLCLSLLVIGATSLASLCLLLFFVYPLSPSEWITGIAEHGQKTVNGDLSTRADFRDYLKNLLLSKDAPLILLYSFFGIPLVVSVYRTFLDTKNKAMGSLPLVTFALIAILLLRGLATPFGRYNFTVFVPTILLIVGVLLPDGVAKYKTATVSLLYVLATAALLTQFIWIDQNFKSRNNAASYNTHLSNLLSAAIDAGLRVGINGSILTALDDADRLQKVRVIRPDSEADPTQFDLVILGQNEHPTQQPIELSGFDIVEVNYDPCCGLLFPRPLNTAFAAYRSKEAAAPSADTPRDGPSASSERCISDEQGME